MKFHPIAAGVCAATAGATLLALPAWSQESTAGLEEIVVTATRREQNLQDVPLAVVAYTGEMLERQGIENMEDINAVVPNVVIAGNLAGTDTASFTMRGIPNVGTYIDGIWQVSNSGLLLREFVELERVEVLRGPQGTLYGRDSTGGAIRLYTKPPASEFGMNVDMTVGNLDRRDVKASVDIPITENFRTRWTLANYDRDGYITSLTTGAKQGGFQDEVIRADFIWEPSDRVSVRFNAQDDEIVSSQARVQTWIEPQLAWNTGIQVGLAQAYDIASGGRWNCNYACSGWPGGVLGEWEGRSEITVPSRQWLEQQTVDVKVALTDDVDFQYLLGHTWSDARTYNDWDAGEFNFYIDYFNTETELTSHEFQFSGGNDRFNWVGGAYFWTQDGTSRNPAWSMREWQEAFGDYGQSEPFSYTNQILPNAACQATPAQRGVGGLFPGGWIFPCNWLPAGWVTALSGGADGVAGDRLVGEEIDGWAYFGEVTIGLSETFDLTLGYRFHDQEEDEFTYNVARGVAANITAQKPRGTNQEWFEGGVYDGLSCLPSEYATPAAIASTGCEAPGRVAFDADTFRVAGSWHITDDVMFYVGFAEGFNAGGVNRYSDSVGPLSSTFNPQTIENTEIAVRTDLVDGRLRFNATYFMTDWDDVQLQSTVRDRVTNQELTELINVNAASAEADGLELEITFAASDSVLLQANLGWLDTAYTDSQHPSVTLNTEFSAAPDSTYNLGIEHEANLMNGGRLVTRFDATYTGPYWRSPVPSLRQNAYGVVRDMESGDYWNYNARLSYTPPTGNYDLTLYGTNLSNDYHLNSGFLHNIWQFDFATVDRPREVGVGVRVRFD
jgi:iron complex outermembrane recepter protein